MGVSVDVSERKQMEELLRERLRVIEQLKQQLEKENVYLEDAERRHILGVLEQTGWRLGGQDGAAAILEIKRTTLQSKMKKLGITRPAK